LERAENWEEALTGFSGENAKCKIQKSKCKVKKGQPDLWSSSGSSPYLSILTFAF
jgi:hypothetical protein